MRKSTNKSKCSSLVGKGYRLLKDGEARQPGDEFILPESESLIRYWKWDSQYDAALQGPGCKPTRRKIVNNHSSPSDIKPHRYAILMEDRSRWEGDALTPMEALDKATKETGKQPSYFLASLEKIKDVSPDIQKNLVISREELIAAATTLRNHQCAYINGENFCDCKFGIGKAKEISGEQTGCCELRIIRSLLTNMTDQEFAKILKR